jgi:hypothetical protein
MPADAQLFRRVAGEGTIHTTLKSATRASFKAS